MSGVSKKQGENILTLQREAIPVLRAAGIADAARDVRILLAHLIGVEPGGILTRPDQVIDHEKADLFRDWINQRAMGRPVHRIIGARAFYNRVFAFNDACLEPRPETELLVERVLADYSSNDNIRFAEVGVGSGVISVTLLCELAMATAVGTDISSGALEATRQNADSFGVGERLELLEADCLNGVEGVYDFIVSNPPYIETGELAALSKEVREHDPLAALDGGQDGLDIYRRIFTSAASRLSRSGRLYLETGHGQHDAILQLAEKSGWGIVSRHLDLSGLERMVVLEKPAI